MQHHSKPPGDPAETVVNARSSPPTAPVDWPASHTARAEYGALRDGIIVLLFGSSQLPKLARSLGQASKEFKKGVSDEGNDEAGGTEANDKKS